MNQLARLATPQAAAIIVGAGEHAALRFFEFFTAEIRNPHTRRAYQSALR